MHTEETRKEPNNWPSEYQPSRVGMFTRVEINIAAPPERVWGCLVQAAEWPKWSVIVSKIRTSSDNGILASGSKILWTRTDLSIRSSIKEFDAGKVIAWESKLFFLKGAYTRWSILSNAIGTRVVLEEAYKGIYSFILGHQGFLELCNRQWLEGLRNFVTTSNI